MLKTIFSLLYCVINAITTDLETIAIYSSFIETGKKEGYINHMTYVLEVETIRMNKIETERLAFREMSPDDLPACPRCRKS